MAVKKVKPEPIVVSTICSLCGERWESHVPDAKGEVSMLECIRLLKCKPCTHISWISSPSVYGVPVSGNTWTAPEPLLGGHTINAIEANSAVSN